MSIQDPKTRKKIWPSDLRSMKARSEKIAVVTAYDFISARIVEESGIPVILVGDSLGNVIAGFRDTIKVSMDQMVYHSSLVARAVQSSLIVTDMPYLSYHVDVKDTLYNAGRLIKEGSADAVKLEGGEKILQDVIPSLVRAQIPVMGHIGLTPQSVNIQGGYHVQGKSTNEKEALLRDALFLEEAGCFAIVLEGMKADIAAEISKSLSIPTIGIGAGKDTDGQVLVLHDLLGFFDKTPKFVRKYANAKESFDQALRAYRKDVETGNFPDATESY